LEFTKEAIKDSFSNFKIISSCFQCNVKPAWIKNSQVWSIAEAMTMSLNDSRLYIHAHCLT
jgi:hypothetical protein